MFGKYEQAVTEVNTIRSRGEVVRVKELLIECVGPICKIGEVCEIDLGEGKFRMAEVIGISEKRVQLMALEALDGLSPGCAVYSTGASLQVKVGDELLGRVMNSLGDSLDGEPMNFYTQKKSIFSEPASLLNRKPIDEIISTGVKALDGLLTVGKGQRMGIFAGSGVGKSTLLSMIARNTDSDVNIVALIGERGREVQEFIQRDLGEEGLKRSIVVVATAQAPALARVRCAFTALTLAEYFRDRGKNVMLMVDSITRMAQAQREIGATLGEIPVTRGYPPSVFAQLPEILERACNSSLGTITAFFNVWVESGDMDEPISDAIRGILDGHVILARKLAEQNHYPAIDIAASISRSMPYVVNDEHLQRASAVKEWIAAYQNVEEALRIGAYLKGSDRRTDTAIAKMETIRDFLRQSIFEKQSLDETHNQVRSLTLDTIPQGGRV